MAQPVHGRAATVPAALVERYEREGWWTDATLGGKVAEWLAAAPDTTVNIHSRTNDWHGTYADIDDEARRLIALLRAEGLEPGDVVAFQMPNWREAIVSFAALAMGGYVLVPIVHIYGRKEVAFILAECGADAYIAPAGVRPRRLHRDHRRGAPDGLCSVHVDASATAPTSPPPDGIRRVGWDQLASFDPVVDLPTPRRRRGGRARLHVGHDERSEGRDPRPPHDAQRAAAHGRLGRRRGRT